MVPRLITTAVDNNFVCEDYSDVNAIFQTTNPVARKQRQQQQQRRRSPVSVSSFNLLPTASTVDASTTTSSIHLETVKSFINKLENEKKIDEAAALYLCENDFQYTSPQFKCTSVSEWMDMKNKTANGNNKLTPTFEDQVTVDVNNTGTIVTRRGVIKNFTSFNVTVKLLETYELNAITGKIQRITVTRI